MELIQQFENFWDFTDPFVNFWISIFHLPDDMMRLSILLIASYLAAIVHRNFLATYTARLYFSLFTGLFWCFFCFKWDALHYIGISFFTYFACRFLPTKQAPRIVLIATFVHLSYGYFFFVFSKIILFSNSTQFLFTININIKSINNNKFKKTLYTFLLISISNILSIGQHQ